MDPNRTNPPSNDMDAAVKKIRAILESDDSKKHSKLYGEMFTIMAAVSPDSPEYRRMIPVLRDMETFTRGDSRSPEAGGASEGVRWGVGAARWASFAACFA